jgi:hypothetical protein
MQVFLKVGKSINKPGGGRIAWPGESFCDVDDELGQSWVDAGDAQLATKDNRIIPDELEPEPTSPPAFVVPSPVLDDDNE